MTELKSGPNRVGMDYIEFDKALLAKVAGGRNTFWAIASGDLARWADDIAGKNRHGDPQGWRLVDRRLQALRKAGKLAYERKTGWRVL